jgi:uncharacterized DUF497 family protein
MKFEWAAQKEAANIAKHGVDFDEAQSAFYDPRLVMAADKGHSQTEPRLFCIGRSKRGGILTVRFTYRGDRIRIIGAGYWRKGRKIYEEQNH